MLSELLSKLCSVTSTVIETDEYLLARMEIKDKAFFAEVTRTEGVQGSGRWPGVQGVLLPVNQRGLPDGYSLLLFSDSGEEFLTERLKRIGSIQIETAVVFCTRLAEIIRKLHSEGRYLGYIGPESVLITRSGRPMLLGCVRGVPDLPFAAPEAIGRMASDPRSDVFALGSLLFRMIAGTDDRQTQIDVWGNLPDNLRHLIGIMVDETPENRHPSMLVLRNALKEYRSSPPDRTEDTVEPGNEREPDTLSQQQSRAGKKNNRMLYGFITVVALGVAAIFLFKPPRDDNGGQPIPDDSRREPAPDTISTDWVQEYPDSSIGNKDDDQVVDLDHDSAVIWISNCTGLDGSGMEYRAGPASDFSYVYSMSGTVVRASSAMLCRRTDPCLSLEQQPLWPLASSLTENDSSIHVLPVDITIFLGTDLSYAGVNSQYIREPETPAGTLYVDVVNNGLQYRLNGQGAAAWTESVLDGKSLDLDGAEWIISVVDSRNGDRLNEELGIPELLDSTMFLYHPHIELARLAEEQIRMAIQSLPVQQVGPPEDLRVPDIWVLLGTSSED